MSAFKCVQIEKGSQITLRWVPALDRPYIPVPLSLFPVYCWGVIHRTFLHLVHTTDINIASSHTGVQVIPNQIKESSLMKCKWGGVIKATVSDHITQQCHAQLSTTSCALSFSSFSLSCSWWNPIPLSEPECRCTASQWKRLRLCHFFQLQLQPLRCIKA